MLSWVIEERNEADFRFLDLPAQKLGFYFWKQKHSLCSSNYSLESLFLFWILTKAKLLPSFLLPSNQAYVELRVGVRRHVCFSYIVKPKTRSKQKRVIQPDQEVQVCEIFLVDSGWTPLDDLSLSLCIFFLDMGYIFFFSSFFSTCLVDMWHTFFGYASFLSLFFLCHAFWACGISSLGMHLLFLFV